MVHHKLVLSLDRGHTLHGIKTTKSIKLLNGRIITDTKTFNLGNPYSGITITLVSRNSHMIKYRLWNRHGRRLSHSRSLHFRLRFWQELMNYLFQQPRIRRLTREKVRVFIDNFSYFSVGTNSVGVVVVITVADTTSLETVSSSRRR